MPSSNRRPLQFVRTEFALIMRLLAKVAIKLAFPSGEGAEVRGG